jgi:hypothetical protein
MFLVGLALNHMRLLWLGGPPLLLNEGGHVAALVGTCVSRHSRVLRRSALGVLDGSRCPNLPRPFAPSPDSIQGATICIVPQLRASVDEDAGTQRINRANDGWQPCTARVCCAVWQRGCAQRGDLSLLPLCCSYVPTIDPRGALPRTESHMRGI